MRTLLLTGGAMTSSGDQSLSTWASAPSLTVALTRKVPGFSGFQTHVGEGPSCTMTSTEPSLVRNS